MPESEQTLRQLKRVNRRTALTLWVVGVPVALLVLFWLAMVLVGPSVELT